MQNAINTPSASRRSSSVVVTAVVLSFVAGGISGGIVGAFAGGLIDRVTNKTASSSTTTDSQLEQNLVVQESSATIDVVNDVMPAVGSVIASKDVTATGGLGTSPFDFFFNEPPTNSEPVRREVSGGTGFILTADGLVLTNKHVVEDTEADYTFIMNDATTYDATVLGRDPFNDLAILKIDGHDLPTVTIGDSSGLQLGQTVIAIGNTFSRYRNTVTKGIVSGVGRTVTAGNGAGLSETLDEVVQTDAAINFGNSGGPLIDLGGNVIGINTAVSTEGENVGFAIPINAAKPVIKTAIDDGRVVRPFLGIRYVAVTPELQTEQSLSVGYGALIPESSDGTPSITPGSAAEKAGLHIADIVLSIDGKEINADQTLSQIMRDFSPGQTVTLTVMRDGKEIELEATLGELEG